MKQKALPMIVLRKMQELATSERDKAVAWLCIGAIFFAMRSCEYLQTAGEMMKRTKIIRLGNIRFKKGTCILDQNHPKLHLCDLVQITFEFQKNDKRDVRIHMFKSEDPVLCPVRAWAETIKRVRAIKDSSDQSPVCLFCDDQGKISNITASYARSKVRAIVQLIGEATLGFTKADIGLHSLRSGGAMAMFLSGVPVVIIMRVGRWSSDAFLEYIRDQIESFTADVSKKMITCEEFVNLNMKYHQDSTSTGRETNASDLLQKEDGPDSVSFNVFFSQLALGQKSKKQR